MKTIIAGSRNVKDKLLVYGAIKLANFKISEIVSGGAKGVDKIGEDYAKENNIPLKVFHADWGLHGMAAGPIRNKEMVDYADALIAVWDGISKGTKNTIELAKKKNIPYFVHMVKAEIDGPKVLTYKETEDKYLVNIQTGKDEDSIQTLVYPKIPAILEPMPPEKNTVKNAGEWQYEKSLMMPKMLPIYDSNSPAWNRAQKGPKRFDNGVLDRTKIGETLARSPEGKPLFFRSKIIVKMPLQYVFDGQKWVPSLIYNFRKENVPNHKQFHEEFSGVKGDYWGIFGLLKRYTIDFNKLRPNNQHGGTQVTINAGGPVSGIYPKGRHAFLGKVKKNFEKLNDFQKAFMKALQAEPIAI